MKAPTKDDEAIASALCVELVQLSLPTKERRKLKDDFLRRFPRMRDAPKKPEPLPKDCKLPDKGTMELEIPW